MIRASLPHPLLVLSGICLAILAWAVEPQVGRAADSAEEAGLKIATEARERQKGFGNFTASLNMTLRNKRGQESTREVRLKVIEVEDDGDRTMQVQFFDRRDEHLKTMVVEDYEKHLDRYWRGDKITMTNHLTGKSTVLLWSNYEFGTDIDVGDFTKTALKRVR